MTAKHISARNPGRRAVIKALAASLIGAPALLERRYAITAGSQERYSARCVDLVARTPVVDLLNQWLFPDWSEDPPRSYRWLSRPGVFTAEEFAMYGSSGIRVFALGHAAGDYERAVRWFADWNGFIAAYGERLLRIDDAADFAAALVGGKVGIMLTFQDSAHFRTPDDVTTFWGLGQRVSQLTYNFQNRLGSGFLENSDGGLTVFGHSILARMEQTGMAVDLSHCGDRTTLDALAAARRPVIYSHASCRALLTPDHTRCKTDEMIRGLARSGGVMGIPFLRFMIRDREPVTIEHVLDHFDHVRRLVGVQHVAIGSDMDIVGNPNSVGRASTNPPRQANFERYRFHAAEDGKITIAGLDHPRRVFDLAEGLIRRGWSDADIGLALGGNAARVLAGIWEGMPAPG